MARWLQGSQHVKPVDQTVLDHVRGNCFSACVASILELTIADVPFFMEPENWWPGFVKWCEERDVAAVYHTGTDYVPAGYSIAGGPSPSDGNTHHACVAHDGVIVHDPHPARLGLAQINDYITIEPKTKAKP